jgi:hypothetical protein
MIKISIGPINAVSPEGQPMLSEVPKEEIHPSYLFLNDTKSTEQPRIGRSKNSAERIHRTMY